MNHNVLNKYIKPFIYKWITLQYLEYYKFMQFQMKSVSVWLSLFLASDLMLYNIKLYKSEWIQELF